MVSPVWPNSEKEGNAMTTYLYWTVILIAAMVALWLIGGLFKQWGLAVVAAVLIGIIGTAAYYFYFQQILVKRYGGVMNITVPEGQHHMGITWKDDHLWIENYQPDTNTCEFREYSRGDMLQGRVVIKNCNPLKATE
jgi:hypothetical protein